MTLSLNALHISAHMFDQQVCVTEDVFDLRMLPFGEDQGSCNQPLPNESLGEYVNAYLKAVGTVTYQLQATWLVTKRKHRNLGACV